MVGFLPGYLLLIIVISFMVCFASLLLLIIKGLCYSIQFWGKSHANAKTDACSRSEGGISGS